MSEILKSEDSVYFRSWGVMPKIPEVIYSAAADIDKGNIGKLPAHQWIIPALDDWSMMEGLLEVKEMYENAAPCDWGVISDFVTEDILVETEVIEQPIEEISRKRVPSANVPRYLVFKLNTSDLETSS